MTRKEIALETLQIQQQGYYEINGRQVDFAKQQRLSEKDSILITPEEGAQIIDQQKPPETGAFASYDVVNQSAVEAVIALCENGISPAVLNFASAKNPGGGFLNGAMAQEEALAAASGLYNTLLPHELYYNANKLCGTMMYTDHAIYSPDVLFFRGRQFELLEYPVSASVLTLPAVNMGQVILKGENIDTAKSVMKSRMRLALALFARQQNSHLILGAYGCGVFRNNPVDIALWWKELLEHENYGCLFSKIVFSVLDNSKTQNNFSAFITAFGGSKP